jgi:hypothetical protein
MIGQENLAGVRPPNFGKSGKENIKENMFFPIES